MRHADYGPDFWRNRGIKGFIGAAINVTLIVIGFFFLGGGTYVRFSRTVFVESSTNFF